MKRLLLLSALALAATNVLAGTGRIVILNVDSAGVGFNDPTPVTPAGGNPGTTRGQARLNVFQHAADRWSAMLDTNVDIRVRASFAPLTCSDTSVVLGAASAITWTSDFTGAPRANVWYPSALANKLAGRDLNPAQDDINIEFNGDLDLPTCAGERSWYYGFDGEEGTDDALYPVVLHEIAHGLGFAGQGVDFYLNRPSIYDTMTLDRIAGRTWDQLTREQRRVSSTNTGNVVWAGSLVTATAPLRLEPKPTLTVTAPSSAARDYDIGTASFGGQVKNTAVSGAVAAARDAANEEGPTNLDGCTAYENAAAVAGKIALVDRGTCTFVQKALTAQNAGAVALVVVDNRANTCLPPSMSGADPDVRIPVISLTQNEGTALRNATGVSAMLRLDPSRTAGSSPEGRVRLYAPCTFDGGSSISHFDTTATPNLLMEPSINSDLIDTVDLTIYLLMDIGWTQPRTGRRILRR